MSAVTESRGGDRGIVRDYALTLSCETDAIVTPITDRSKKGFSGAVYTRDGMLVPQSERLVGSGAAPENPPSRMDLAPRERIEGTSLFGGIMFRNFGHFLLEGTCRLWPALDSIDRTERIVYAAYTPHVVEQVAEARPDGYLSILLDAAGYAPDDVILVTEQEVAFERLIVPQSSFAISGYAHPRFREVFDRVVENLGLDRAPPADARRRVYFSRRQLAAKKRHAVNEAEIEALAIAAGFEIVHPERLAFPEQIALVRDADVIAGCDGSALHLSVFARPGTRVLSLDTRQSMTQLTIEAALGLQGIRVVAFAEPPSKDNKWNRIHGWTADLAAISRAFADLR